MIDHSPLVLVVDDEPNILNALERVLGLRFRVTTASSAQMAFSKATREVSLIMSDFSMPEKDGVDLARLLRGSGTECPIAILTADPEHPKVLDAMNRGLVQAILMKPWGANRGLVDRVEALLAGQGEVARGASGGDEP